MHQQSRLPPKLSSPATSPQTNPTRANNPRDALATTGRARSGSEVAGQEVGVGPESGNNVTSGPTKESIKKLDQIIQVRRTFPVPLAGSFRVDEFNRTFITKQPFLFCSLESMLPLLLATRKQKDGKSIDGFVSAGFSLGEVA